MRHGSEEKTLRFVVCPLINTVLNVTRNDVRDALDRASNLAPTVLGSLLASYIALALYVPAAFLIFRAMFRKENRHSVSLSIRSPLFLGIGIISGLLWFIWWIIHLHLYVYSYEHIICSINSVIVSMLETLVVLVQIVRGLKLVILYRTSMVRLELCNAADGMIGISPSDAPVSEASRDQTSDDNPSSLAQLSGFRRRSRSAFGLLYEQVRRLKENFSNRRMLIWLGLAMLVPLISTVVVAVVVFPTALPFNKYDPLYHCQCLQGYRITSLMLICILSVLSAILIWIGWKLRSVTEVFAVKTELFIQGSYILVAVIVFSILRFVLLDFTDGILIRTLLLAILYLVFAYSALISMSWMNSLSDGKSGRNRNRNDRGRTKSRSLLLNDNELQHSLHEWMQSDISLEAVLANLEARNLFRIHLLKEFSIENLMFLESFESACLDLGEDLHNPSPNRNEGLGSSIETREHDQSSSSTMRKRILEDLVNLYIVPGSANELNLPHQMRTPILIAAERGQLSLSSFYAIRSYIKRMLSTDTLLRFRRTSSFQRIRSSLLESQMRESILSSRPFPLQISDVES